ncbi:MAG: ASCH domain-containing protein [Candidatus Pacebacteria bacterium]|nr:ASCH domain-containing protein [Candidatus Paceibacterota bacterium]
MNHIAVMKKSWGLIEKILTGEKTIESRWYKSRYSPWNKIKPSDVIYFKDSGGPVSVRAEVVKVLQFDNLTAKKIEQILFKYGKVDLGTSHIMPEIREYVSGKNYCILVFFDNVEKIKPFNIDKTGFGAMSAWISVDDINRLKKAN